MPSLLDLSREAAALAVKVASEHHPKADVFLQDQIERAVDHLLRAKARLARASRLAKEEQPRPLEYAG